MWRSVQPLAAVRHRPGQVSLAQRLQRQVGQDVLAQHLVQIDLVVLVDAAAVVLVVGSVERHAGADVGAGQELFVERAATWACASFEAARALER